MSPPDLEHLISKLRSTGPKIVRLERRFILKSLQSLELDYEPEDASDLKKKQLK